MDFIKRKMSRIGYQLCHYKVLIKPLSLDLVVESSGEAWLTLKRGRHRENTERHRVETSGSGRHSVQVVFGKGEVLARVSDFYRSKGVVQEKKAKFQVFFQQDGGASQEQKVCTVEVNLTQFIGRGLVKEAVQLKGDGKVFEFEVLIEEGTAD